MGGAARAEHAASAQRRRGNRRAGKGGVGTAMAKIETLFWDESWVRLAVDGSARVGVVLPGLRGAAVTGSGCPASAKSSTRACRWRA